MTVEQYAEEMLDHMGDVDHRKWVFCTTHCFYCCECKHCEKIRRDELELKP